MDLERLWAGVTFTAQNGDTEGLLTAAAQGGIHLSHIIPHPGGFDARCAAWRYRPLAKLARRRRVHLRVQKRTGLFFRIRPLLHRAGLWGGVAIFVPLLLWSQSFVWAIEAPGLTRGQQARAAVFLYEAGLMPGDRVTEEKLAAGEYALVQSGEFSWASLNFLNGRLVVEAAAAKAVPDIAAGTLHGIRARVAGTVVSTNLVSGTMLVTPGQAVEAGQGLIGTARAERDGTLIFEPAAGTVRAEFTWTHTQTEPLVYPVEQLTGQRRTVYRVTFARRTITLPALPPGPEPEQALTVTRHIQPELFGLRLPLFVEEMTQYGQQTVELTHTEEQALALARLHCRQTLAAACPDANVTAQAEQYTVENDTLHYTVRYTVIADICE